MATGHAPPAAALLVLILLAIALALPSAGQEPVVVGLDHIPVAVADLDRASATYRTLGFALKPGRPHTNGLRNAHVKFPDGAGVELLATEAAADALTAHYVQHLRAGEGPAFFALHARDTGKLHAALQAGGYAFRQEGDTTTLVAPEFASLFFVRDNRSPTDRPEHFAHPNGATALRAVWLATEHREALAGLFVRLGGRRSLRQVLAPGPVEATVVALGEGEVILLPEQYQVVPGRPMIGASFLVADLGPVQRMLAQAHIEPWPGATAAPERVVVEPRLAHGLWLEFRGRR